MKLASKLLVAVAILSGVASAQTSKVSMQFSDMALINSDPGLDGGTVASTDSDWTPVFQTRIHMPNDKDLMMGVSLEAGLLTSTSVVSKNLDRNTATARAKIQVRVKIINEDTNAVRTADPGEIVFAEREQKLAAALSGYFECVDDGDLIIEVGECTYTEPEEIALALRTLNANSFFFGLTDLTSGWHKVVVEARVKSGPNETTYETGVPYVLCDPLDPTNCTTFASEAKAGAWIGKGAVTVEAVRLVKDQDILNVQF